MVQVAIIADDLTGALDSAAPFVGLGMTASVVTHIDALPDIMAMSSDVVAVNTGSRDIAGDAGERAAHCARRLAPTGALQIKKIDTRLKGHIEQELAGVMHALSCTRVLVLPASPAVGRYVVDGCVVGAGVPVPVAIRTRLGTLAPRALFPDCRDQAALNAAIDAYLDNPDGTLLAGASGAAAAVAERLASQPRRSPPTFAPELPILFVIGSRDPITIAQIEELRQHCPDVAIIEAPHGVADIPARSPSAATALLATPGTGAADPARVATCLAATAARIIVEANVRTIVASGGESAFAVLDALNVRALAPRGEVTSGIPWSVLTEPGGVPRVFVSKSGGFGEPDALVAIYRCCARR